MFDFFANLAEGFADRIIFLCDALPTVCLAGVAGTGTGICCAGVGVLLGLPDGASFIYAAAGLITWVIVGRALWIRRSARTGADEFNELR
jgi:hypothetical protein